jgi:hypothetical protein
MVLFPKTGCSVTTELREFGLWREHWKYTGPRTFTSKSSQCISGSEEGSVPFAGRAFPVRRQETAPGQTRSILQIASIIFVTQDQ